MQRRTLTAHIEEHIATRQESGFLPVHEVDQINAAALDGARSFDISSSLGRELGLYTHGPVDSRELFDKLAERFGDPFTELLACAHFDATPIQPAFVHAATPDRVMCGACFKRLALTDVEAIRRYAASTDCDACGVEVQHLHPGKISNGMVTFVVYVCASCLPSHS
jgi:hypothetical protein